MPPEYEDNISYIAFIKNGLPILEVHLSLEKMKDTMLFTGYVSAIKSFSKEYYNRELKRIDQGDLILGFETGKIVSVVYIAKSISDELETKMRSLLMAFEFKFASTLEEKIVKSSQFENFKEMIFQTLSTEFIKEFYVPILTSQIENDDIPKLIPDEGWGIIAVIDGSLTVEEIAEKADRSITSTIEILALMRAQGLVEFITVVNMYDIPAITSKGATMIVESNLEHESTYEAIINMFSDKAIEVIRSINGKFSAKRLSEKASLLQRECKELLELLLSKDYISLLTEGERVSAIAESLYSALIIVISKDMGSGANQFVDNRITSEKTTLLRLVYLNLNNVPIFDNVKVYLKEKKITDEIINELLKPFTLVLKELKRIYGKSYADHVRKSVFEELKTLFGEENLNRIEELMGLSNA